MSLRRSFIVSGVTRGYKEITPSYVGGMCASYRRYFTDKSQDDVADEIGCSREAVSKFERGRVCNAIIFLWYIQQGIFNWLPADKWDGWNSFAYSERSEN